VELVCRVIHLLEDLPLDPVVDVAALDGLELAGHVDFLLVGGSLPQNRADEHEQGILDMDLNLPEFLITSVLQDFSEQSYLVIFTRVELHAVHDG